MSNLFTINNLQPGKRTTICKIDPTGSLSATLKSTGMIVLFYRYMHGGSNTYLPIGTFNPKAAPRSVEPSADGYSLAAAKLAATRMAIEHQASLNEGRDGLAIDRKAAAEVKAAQRAIDTEIKTQTVEKLCTMYIATLKNKGTAGDARSTFKHIPAKVLKLTACHVTTDAWTDVLRLLANKHPRTANKLRSYLMAAYNLARYAKADMSIDVAFKAFKVSGNPFEDTRPNSLGGSNADKNPLSRADMQTYWSLIKNVEGVKGAALRIHLLTGGLRILQLLRLQKKDIDLEQGIFTLYDEKGKRKHAARYSTPILPMLQKDFDLLLNQTPNDCLFCLQGMTNPIANTTLLNWAKELVGDCIDGFTLKRIRSGVETLLASKNVSKDIRGRLQSHGISGVQDTHYDAHDYIEQKTHALNILQQVVTATPATVIKMAGVA